MARSSAVAANPSPVMAADGSLLCGDAIGGGGAEGRDHLVASERQTLRAVVPKTLSPARVGIVPAQPGLRRGACPRGGGRSADETERRASRDRAAGRPAIIGRTDPYGATVDGSMDRTVDGAVDRSMDRAMLSRPVDRALMSGAMGRTMMDAGASGGALRAAAMAPAAPARRDRGDHSVHHMDDGAGPADDLDGFGLRRAVTAKR